MAEKLLTGTDELYQPEGGSSSSSAYSSQKQNKSLKPKSNSRIDKLPEPGEALIENLQNILGELNGSKSKKNTSTVTLSNRDKQHFSSTNTNPLRAGSHFAKLQEDLDKRNKNNSLHSTNQSAASIASVISVTDKR